MPENPFTKRLMARYEYRLARENRRLAEIEVRKAEIDKMSGEDISYPRSIKYGVIGLAVIFVILTLGNCIDGMVKNYHVERNLTDCEKYATQAHVEADCAVGKIKAPK